MQAQHHDDLLDHTIEVFQPLSRERLTREDAQEIVEDVASFLTLLASWDREALGRTPAAPREGLDSPPANGQGHR